MKFKYLIGVLTLLIAFQSFAHQNVLIICVDDMRFDDLSLTGGPDFISTPNIDRIGIEGANFENGFVVYSKCKPSKGTMLSGWYPHVYRESPKSFIDNGIAKHVKSSGYNTAFIGKYHYNKTPQPFYDRWVGFATFNPFINPTLNIDGSDSIVNGHLTDVLTDFAVAYIEENQSNPFMLFLSYKAVHVPATPQPRYDGMFDTVGVSLPPLNPLALVNKPSFIQPICENDRIQDLLDQKQNMYELMTGLDECIGRVLDTLDSRGLSDSTLVIFMSDNGFMYGENRLAATKKWAYEHSMRIPILMRYPPTIPGGTVVPDFALNLDLAETVYDFLDINTATSQGISLFDFIDGTDNRNEFLYEFINDFSGTGVPGTGQSNIPTFRAVRNNQYKFIDHLCDQKQKNSMTFKTIRSNILISLTIRLIQVSSAI